MAKRRRMCALTNARQISLHFIPSKAQKLDAVRLRVLKGCQQTKYYPWKSEEILNAQFALIVLSCSDYALGCSGAAANVFFFGKIVHDHGCFAFNIPTMCIWFGTRHVPFSGNTQ